MSVVVQTLTEYYDDFKAVVELSFFERLVIL